MNFEDMRRQWIESESRGDRLRKALFIMYADLDTLMENAPADMIGRMKAMREHLKDALGMDTDLRKRFGSNQ